MQRHNQNFSHFQKEKISMFGELLSLRNRLVKQVRPLLFATVALALTATTAHAQSCHPVRGHYVEHAVVENCDSPVGLCIAGEYSGVIKGNFEGDATSLVPTADTPTTSVLLFTSDSVIHAKVKGKEGDLLIKNAGVFRTTGEGEILDLQTIVGGTGELAGASGIIRADGVFDSATGSGESEYVGNICLP
jgi:hypothetical protein